MIKEPTVRLIYHLWIPKDLDDDMKKMLDIHFACLRSYIHLFNNVLFVLSVDDITDKEIIKKYEDEILSFGYRGNLQFKVVENDSNLREGLTYYNEIIKKLGELDGLTFFAHDKGLTNVKNYIFDSIGQWVTFMYWDNLRDLEIIKKRLLENVELCSGTLMLKSPFLSNKNKWYYVGSFHWCNFQRLEYVLKNKGDILPTYADRIVAENFLGNHLSVEKDLPNQKMTTTGIYFYETDKPECFNFYENSPNLIKAYLDDEILHNEFLQYYNKILKNVENNT